MLARWKTLYVYATSIFSYRRTLTWGAKCNAIHKTIVEQFKHAIVYGKSVKHQPQRVGLAHELADEDISWSSLADSAIFAHDCDLDNANAC